MSSALATLLRACEANRAAIDAMTAEPSKASVDAWLATLSPLSDAARSPQLTAELREVGEALEMIQSWGADEQYRDEQVHRIRRLIGGGE